MSGTIGVALMLEPIFTNPFNDWEVEEVERHFYELGRFLLVDETEEVSWMLIKSGVLSVIHF